MTRRGWWQLLVVALIGTARVAAAAWADPVLMPDSERYRNDASPLSPFQFWNGDGPGVLVQTINLLPLDAAAIVQTITAVVLWGAAALYAASLSTPRRSWIVLLALQMWSLSPWFLIWDTWILTEPLTLAGCALAAVGVAGTRTNAHHAHWVTIAGLVVAVTARPFVGAMLLPLVMLALIWPLSLSRLRAHVTPITATLLVAAFATWNVIAFATAASSPFSYLPEPESLKQVQATDRIAGRGHLPGYLDLARQEGMPPCPEAETLAIAPLSEHDKLPQLRELDDCPEFDDWLADGGLSWTSEFVSNTGPTMTELVRPTYWLEESFVDYVVSDQRMLKVRVAARTKWHAVVIVVNSAMLGLSALACIGALAVGRGDRAFMTAAIAVVAAVSLQAWGTDGIEYWRHLLPAFAVLPVSALALLGRDRARV